MNTTKENILIEALRLFAVKGYQSVSVNEIGRHCGISAPAIYKHYINKMAILEAIIELSNQGFEIQMRKLYGANKEVLANIDRNTLTTGLLNVFEHTLKDEMPALVRKMLTVEQFNISEVGKVYNQRYIDFQLRTYANIFEALMANGKMVKADSNTLALTYISPVIVFIGVCDRQPERIEVCKEMLKNHINEFLNNYYFD